MELDLVSYRDVDSKEDIVKATPFALMTGLAFEHCVQSYWTRNISEVGYVYVITPHPVTGLNRSADVKANYYFIGIRPVLKLTKDEFQKFKGKEMVMFGEYPQGINHDPSLESFLNKNIDNLTKTGRKYSYVKHSNRKHEVINIPEYIYKGEKYVTMVADKVCHYDKEVGMRPVNADERVWLKVAPVEWIVDDSWQSLTATKILLGGVPFDNSLYINYYNDSYIKAFIDSYMVKEMFSTTPKNSMLESDEVLKDYFLGEKRRQLIKVKN